MDKLPEYVTIPNIAKYCKGMRLDDSAFQLIINGYHARNSVYLTRVGLPVESIQTSNAWMAEQILENTLHNQIKLEQWQAVLDKLESVFNPLVPRKPRLQCIDY